MSKKKEKNTVRPDFPTPPTGIGNSGWEDDGGAIIAVITKIHGEWKVNNLEVHRNDIIDWTLDGTDAYFQFHSSELFSPCSEKDRLDDGYKKFVRNENHLRLIVKDDAPLGTWDYAVFCSEDNEYASADSPPIIIIS